MDFRKNLATALLSLGLVFSGISSVMAQDYTDIPADYWAAEEIEDVVTRATDILYSYNTDQVTSKQIGEAVLDVLADVNEVAYVRFASVFREFKTLEDFEKIFQTSFATAAYTEKERGRRGFDADQ